MKIKRDEKVLFFLLCMTISVSLWALEEKEDVLSYEATYMGDYVNNMSGGLKTGDTYLGYATMGLAFDFEKAGLWKNGLFYVAGGNTHGGEPSADFIGDMHIVDNIEAENHTFLQALWLSQTFGKWSIKVGLQDLNADFAVCDYSSNYLHSTFGINAVYAGNICAPIFPITGLAIQTRWNINDSWHWQVAVFDGQVFGFEENPYNVKWKLNASKGYIVTSECHYTIMNKGSYKLGAYYHTGNDKYGVYGVVNYPVWRGKKTLDTFLQVAYAPKYNNETYLQLIGGLNYSNVWFKDDMLGLAATSSLLSEGDVYHETVVELTYKCPVYESLFIQPDLQYVISPAGMNKKLDNALVAIIRFGFDF